MSRMLLVAMLLASGAVSAAPVDPFLPIGGQTSFVKGVDRYYPVQIQRTAPKVAAAEGGMWLPQPDGGRVFARTVRVIEQDGGIETWIGKVSIPGGDASVVLTMGPDAAFGSLVTSSGKPYRLVTRQGHSYLVQQDASAARLNTGGPVLNPPGLDYRVAPTEPAAGYLAPQSLETSSGTAAATSSGPTVANTIDVLLAYTPGMVSRLGSASAVQTRLTYIVAVANQAYADSKVNYRIRLAGTMAVNYPDTGPNSQVLDDMTNTSPTGPLAGLRARRARLGADLVNLIRPFSKAGQGGFCGLGYLIGQNESPVTKKSAPYGYSTASDGDDPATNYYCLDTTLAHELGHNMGLAHDKADATAPGAYSYAYGWRQTLSSGSFSTIMAYSASGQKPVPYFANPNITVCNGHRCGDPVVANQTLALNQTMPIVSTFLAGGHASVDINADGQADILLADNAGGSFTTLMEKSNFQPTTNTHATTAGYRIAAMGDLNGDGKADLVWTNAANDLYFWLGNGADAYQSIQGPSYAAGWQLSGTGDINGDGNADLLWINHTTNQFMYWLMQGSTVADTRTMSVAAGYSIAAIGDFNGDGRADIAWTSAARDLYIWTSATNGGFSSARSLSYPAGWRIVGSGNMNDDGRADLVWINDTGHQFAYWLMSGSTRVGYRIVDVNAGYTIAGIDRYSSSGDGILWTSASNDLYVWKNSGNGGFVSVRIAAYPAAGGGYSNTYPTGWSVVSNLPNP